MQRPCRLALRMAVRAQNLTHAFPLVKFSAPLCPCGKPLWSAARQRRFFAANVSWRLCCRRPTASVQALSSALPLLSLAVLFLYFL